MNKQSLLDSTSVLALERQESTTDTSVNMTTLQAANYLCSNTSTLADWRMKGVGPKFCVAGRRVIYRRHWLDEWLESRAVTSTAEAKRLGAA